MFGVLKTPHKYPKTNKEIQTPTKLTSISTRPSNVNFFHTFSYET